MEVWEISVQGGGWNPGFRRPFNYLEMRSVIEFIGVIRDRRVNPQKKTS